MKTELKTMNNGINNAEEWISNLEDRIMKNTQSGQKVNEKKNEGNIWDLWIIYHANLCIIGIPEGEERGKELKTTYEEIMAKNFPKPKERNRHPGPTRSTEVTCLTSDYTTKPQSSRQYGIGTKTEI